jgi:hypothetical protein
MGYTIEKGKIVIWTQKIFIADDYPFQDEGENITYFFKNLKDRTSFASCLARVSNEDKILFAANVLGENPSEIILKSKKSHRNKKKNAGI